MREKPRDVFEGTIGTSRYLFDARSKTLEKIVEVPSEKGPAEVALANHLRIIPRKDISFPEVVAQLKKCWAIARADIAPELLQEQKKQWALSRRKRENATITQLRAEIARGAFLKEAPFAEALAVPAPKPSKKPGKRGVRRGS